MTLNTAGDVTRVGRWMSLKESLDMKMAGKVQESYSGTTYVALPADAATFLKQARQGSVYLEFDVPTSSLVSTSPGWAKIIGPNSLEGRWAARKRQPVPQMPEATRIVHIADMLL